MTVNDTECQRTTQNNNEVYYMVLNDSESYPMTVKDAEWYWMSTNDIEWYWMAVNDAEQYWVTVNDTEWQWMATNGSEGHRMILNNNEGHYMILNNSEWYWMTVNDTAWYRMTVNATVWFWRGFLPLLAGSFPASRKHPSSQGVWGGEFVDPLVDRETANLFVFWLLINASSCVRVRIHGATHWENHWRPVELNPRQPLSHCFAGYLILTKSCLCCCGIQAPPTFVPLGLTRNCDTPQFGTFR